MSDPFAALAAIAAQHDAAVKAVTAAEQKRAWIEGDVSKMGIVYRDNGYSRGAPEGIGLTAMRDVIEQAKQRAVELADADIAAAKARLFDLRMDLRRRVIAEATKADCALTWLISKGSDP